MLFAEPPSGMNSARPIDERQRARFDALRSNLFTEMARAGARWRLAWLLPFHLLVFALLFARGEPPVRIAVQGIALVFAVITFVYPWRANDVSPSGQLCGLIFGALCYFTCIANTGGLASPLLVIGIPMLSSVALMPMPTRLRKIFFSLFMSGHVVLALLSRTWIGELVSPLAPIGAWASVEYVVISVGAVIISGLSLYATGIRVSHVYERVAFELTERREELCTETQERTRELEGIAARLAHEVKNPLAAIKGLSTHMARNSEDPKMAERLAIVAAEADRLQGIVDGFLSFSRGLDSLHLTTTKPYEIARELTLLLETRASDGDILLEVTGKPDLTLTADARKLRQALLNIVINAMQASPRGTKVTIDVSRGCSGNARIAVIDRGEGMSADILERIRRPYFTTREGGSGLGIAVARGLIEQHGGNLHYESVRGKGTKVTIELLPCASAAAAASKLPNPARDAVVTSS